MSPSSKRPAPPVDNKGSPCKHIIAVLDSAL
ncbi:MAG: SWIM zinc finger family protein [Acidobacteria bacterium]|nr:SWIM zinc finger family protein [Acidobacteriota bacterium]